MCLIVFAWKTHPEFPLILAANRDEFHHRPTGALRWWADNPDVLAGRDLQAGGTWLAAARSGRIATVTNYRERRNPRSGIRSRGDLVTGFVTGDEDPDSFSRAIEGEDYAGFNLLTASDDKLCYVSNRGDKPVVLAPGIYGLSNASLDTPWTKLRRTRDILKQLVAADSINETELMRMMSDRCKAPVDEVEAGPFPFEIRRSRTAPFIVAEDYGTRCTTVLLRNREGVVSVSERSFDAVGDDQGTARFEYSTRR